MYAATACAVIWSSGRGIGLWGVTHPVNNIGHGGGGPAKEAPDYGTCPKCHLALPAAGRCYEFDELD